MNKSLGHQNRKGGLKMPPKISLTNKKKSPQGFELMNRLCEDISELRERVSRLEQSLLRGLWLLVANLLGVIFSLVQQNMFNNY